MQNSVEYTEHDLALEQREELADADAWPGAEWHKRISVFRRAGFLLIRLLRFHNCFNLPMTFSQRKRNSQKQS